MTAFALSLAIFSIWSMFGCCLLSVLGNRRNLVRNALLAPAMGEAALAPLLFELYRFGLAVRIAAQWHLWWSSCTVRPADARLALREGINGFVLQTASGAFRRPMIPGRSISRSSA